MKCISTWDNPNSISVQQVVLRDMNYQVSGNYCNNIYPKDFCAIVSSELLSDYFRVLFLESCP